MTAGDDCALTDLRRRKPARAEDTRARLAVACATALLCLLVPATARADGDPASDILLESSTFIPADAGVPAADQASLRLLVQEARAAGFPIKVALIATPYDLGSITALWRKPQLYARFLGTEIAPVYRGPLLVVMPNGLALYDARHPHAHRPTLSGIHVGAGGTPLAVAAERAVRQLAGAAGHPLALPQAKPPRTPGANRTTDWIVFAIGALAIVFAWTISLRLRPLRRRRRPQPGV